MKSEEQKVQEVEAVLDGNPLMTLPGYIVLIKKPNDDRIYGPTEHSFSLGVQENETFFFWEAPLGHPRWRHKDGKKDAEEELRYWKQKYPDWEMKIYDARDTNNLPIVINWAIWLDGHKAATNTLSGIKNKYTARNLSFRPRSNL